MQFIDNDNVAHIIIHEDVTEEIAQEINYFVYGLEFYPEITSIEVSINSLGGSVLGGYTIFSSLKKSTKKIITRIEGFACSIASWIFLAGEERTATDYSLFMIHNPSGGDNKSLLAVKESLMSVYKSFFPNEDELNSLLNDETWLSPEDLKERGIVQNIIYTNNSEVQLQLEISNSTDLLRLHALCNKVNKKNSEPMKKSLIDKVKEEFAKLTNKVTLTNADEVDPKKEEATEDPKEEETKADAEEETSEDEVYQQLMDMVKALSDKIESLMKANEEAEAENKALKNKNADEEKTKVLTEAGIENKDFDKWLKLDIDTIKNLSKTIKVSVKAPEDKISNEIKFDFDKMTKEEKINLLNTSPDEYYNLFRKSGNKK